MKRKRFPAEQIVSILGQAEFGIGGERYRARTGHFGTDVLSMEEASPLAVYDTRNKP